MTAIEFAVEFVNNRSKMEKYNQAISLLREAGFENVLRRIGEPTAFPLDHPQHLAVSAFEQAERRGWFQALDFLFDFQSSMNLEARKSAGGDFGAKDKLRSLGFDEETIRTLDEDNG